MRRLPVRFVPVLVLLSFVIPHTLLHTAQALEKASAVPVIVSATAEAIYRDAKPRLLQIRTLLNSASQKSSTGSGFLISADGLAITNYHVVSQHALEPQTYRMEYISADGSKGSLKLLAFDTVNDLALVQLDKSGWTFFEFDQRALVGRLPRGERLFSLGNPLDIGFAVMEGNYSGLVERSYNDRIHLSGPMNPGMSGGPTLTTDSRIAGINVAKSGWGTEQVSFLVPARFATALMNKPRLADPLSGKAVAQKLVNNLASGKPRCTTSSTPSVSSLRRVARFCFPKATRVFSPAGPIPMRTRNPHRVHAPTTPFAICRTRCSSPVICIPEM